MDDPSEGADSWRLFRSTKPVLAIVLARSVNDRASGSAVAMTLSWLEILDSGGVGTDMKLSSGVTMGEVLPWAMTSSPRDPAGSERRDGDAPVFAPSLPFVNIWL